MSLAASKSSACLGQYVHVQAQAPAREDYGDEIQTPGAPDLFDRTTKKFSPAVWSGAQALGMQPAPLSSVAIILAAWPVFALA
jgi:hypothetical protein